mmetsp:Transcript_77554/g.136838  ORF Transcript_77554/g.136838 Transcript_77554/m.136838 type:complete len:341 (+) Transcript_77554:89-1111(+)|eukprot:CAMPEP_0197631492 /NCGR_PEP_ID=MMETSP1338-20131121/8640_1 /TAXON_ID=43686 ORGANISM="Pelagodinium beii, Strain RCC1491" /NCGR_SAMPLE_ID=MMETSP1338 /ASSEMBLY_ACC=CAM_ASM_000754 /LENGTH=340 /DNA_ID=CAMNT_0043202959 /DNA_START=45 /DNA_END=1067 /DNA_ORIENTATION=+
MSFFDRIYESCCNPSEEYKALDQDRGRGGQVRSLGLEEKQAPLRMDGKNNEIELQDEYGFSMEPEATPPESNRCLTCCKWFGIVLALMAGLMLIGLIVARCTASVTCVVSSEIDQYFPKTPEDYPKGWRGIIWMDQDGVYGSEDAKKGGSGSVAMSFGDSVWDPDAKSIVIRKTGTSWALMGNTQGYADFLGAQFFGHTYYFAFEENFTYAQIYPGVSPFGGLLGTWYMPKRLVSWTMEMQDTLGEECPPESAEWDKVRACAKWIRKSSSPLFPALGVSEYACFEVVGEDGKPTSYFSPYIEYADGLSKPDSSSALILLGLDTEESKCIEGESSIVSLKE